MNNLTLDEVLSDLSFYFKFKIDSEKSLNIDYKMDGEEVVYGIIYLSKIHGYDEKEVLGKFNYSKYFKQGIIYPAKQVLRKYIGLDYDNLIFKEEVPLHVVDILELFE